MTEWSWEGANYGNLSRGRPPALLGHYFRHHQSDHQHWQRHQPSPHQPDRPGPGPAGGGGPQSILPARQGRPHCYRGRRDLLSHDSRQHHGDGVFQDRQAAPDHL